MGIFIFRTLWSVSPAEYYHLLCDPAPSMPCSKNPPDIFYVYFLLCLFSKYSRLSSFFSPIEKIVYIFLDPFWSHMKLLRTVITIISAISCWAVKES